MVRCVVRACTMYSDMKIPNLSFHSFPKDENLKKIWIENTTAGQLNPTKLKNARICSRHFTSDCVFPAKKKPRLHADAVPTLNLYDEEKEEVFPLQVKEEKDPFDSETDSTCSGDETARVKIATDQLPRAIDPVSVLKIEYTAPDTVDLSKDLTESETESACSDEENPRKKIAAVWLTENSARAKAVGTPKVLTSARPMAVDMPKVLTTAQVKPTVVPVDSPKVLTAVPNTVDVQKQLSAFKRERDREKHLTICLQRKKRIAGNRLAKIKKFKAKYYRLKKTNNELSGMINELLLNQNSLSQASENIQTISTDQNLLTSNIKQSYVKRSCKSLDSDQKKEITNDNIQTQVLMPEPQTVQTVSKEGGNLILTIDPTTEKYIIKCSNNNNSHPSVQNTPKEMLTKENDPKYSLYNLCNTQNNRINTAIIKRNQIENLNICGTNKFLVIDSRIQPKSFLQNECSIKESSVDTRQEVKHLMLAIDATDTNFIENLSSNLVKDIISVEKL